MSGFILTHVDIARRDTSYWRFIRVRHARIWPIHLVTLLLVVLVIQPATFDENLFFDKRLTRAAGHSDRIIPFKAYCTGLLLPGEHKSVVPMAARLAPDNVRRMH